MSTSRTALPRILIAAPASGSGKTMIATGLMAALRERGLSVSPHKVGPDYIDPGYHGAACGRPGRNLDAHLLGEDRIVPLLLHGATVPEPADIAVVEGVMGLFDGALGGRGYASSAHIARLTSTPVLLVVNCAAASRSVGAVVVGFTLFDTSVRIAGVVLNNVASARHEAEARAGVEEAGVPVVGAIPRLPDVVVPSRHLGLVPAAERRPEALSAIAALARMARDHLDLDLIVDLARAAPALTGEPWDPAGALAGYPRPSRPPRVAVVGGEAFTFGYAETPELLAAAGAQVLSVDPLRDESLPAGTDAFVVGGGFPEIHAAALSANVALRRQVADLAAGGGPIAAECAGLLYLARSLDSVPMCAVLPVDAAMSPRLTLGYRSAVALGASALAEPGTRVTGHEFHRTRILTDDDADADAGADPAWGWAGPDGEHTQEGYVRGRVHASYLHVHWAGHPSLAASFVRAAAGHHDGGRTR